MSALIDTDILKADDAALRVLAAEAMGWKPPRAVDGFWASPGREFSNMTFNDLPNAPVCLDDAVALAEHNEFRWMLQSDNSGMIAQCWAKVGDSCIETDDPPAAALTRAVLLALQAKVPA